MKYPYKIMQHFDGGRSTWQSRCYTMHCLELFSPAITFIFRHILEKLVLKLACDVRAELRATFCPESSHYHADQRLFASTAFIHGGQDSATAVRVRKAQWSPKGTGTTSLAATYMWAGIILSMQRIKKRGRGALTSTKIPFNPFIAKLS